MARWEEVDWKARTWTLPAARMQAGREHRVPLSRPALAVLFTAKGIDNGTGLIFPSKWTGRDISDMTHGRSMRKLGIMAADGQFATPHGFRSSFRDWTLERTDTPWAIAEAALARVVGNATEAAYARTDLFELRRVLMAAWADYLAGDTEGRDVERGQGAGRLEAAE